MAEALIDLDQLAQNIQTVQARLKGCRLCFPVKANAYGHGAVELARRAQVLGVDYFGVANLSEALELRRAAIEKPILIFSASRRSHIPELVEAEVDVTVSSMAFAETLDEAAARRGRRVRVQLKVDTGMGRNGVWWEDALAVAKRLSQLAHLDFVGVFSHFSASYSQTPEDRAFTLDQIEAFEQLLEAMKAGGVLPRLRHIANSSGLIQYEERVASGAFNMVRPGILLYGEPEVRRPWTAPIRPILRLRSWVTSVSALPAGRYIGYGREYRTPTPARIATLPIGYADGVSWWLKNQGKVLIHGQLVPIVGGVSMDQITVDVSDVPQVKPDDEVYLIHDKLSALDVAHVLGASFSEIVLTALSRRVARTYVGHPSPCPLPCG